VWRRFGPDIRSGAFDVVHRVTPLSPTATSTLAARCRRAGVPFVLGPLNGGVPWPRGFQAERRREREWLSYVRDIYKLSPGRRSMYAATSAVLAGSLHTASEVPDVARERVVYIPENAIDPARFDLSAAGERPGTGPLRAVFVGRCVPYKGPDMLIEAALPFLMDGRLCLDVVGDGPLLPDLRRMAATAPDGAVVFHGWLEHRAVQTVLAKADVLAFPSIREFGGGVVIEAMAMGAVPLVADYAGPAELVAPGTGFKVPVAPRAVFVEALRAALGGILDDRARLPEMSAKGRALILSHFTWEAKAAQVREVYDWVLGRRPQKPVFGFPAESGSRYPVDLGHHA
jgi:glycosyltransferase involved in cell wall biosynthesis